MSDGGLPIRIPGNIELSKKKKVNEIRIISDEFKICIPKLVWVQKWVYGEKTKVIHFKDDKVFEMDLK